MELNSQYPQQYPHLPSNPNPPQNPWQPEATGPQPTPITAQAHFQQPVQTTPAPPQPQWQEPAVQSPLPEQPGLRPTPVVKVLSPLGVEYIFLTITLLTGATSLITALLLLINGGAHFSALAFPTAALTVTVPVFALIFLDLKKQEMRRPELKLDPSKRRSTQFTQIVAFLVSLMAIIGFVFSIFGKMSGDNVSIWKAFLDTIFVLAVAGGILAYYWNDEHKTSR